MAAHSITNEGLHGRHVGNGQGSWLTTWLRDTVRHISNRLSWRHHYRETFREISALSDRELDDVGIVRCDIRMIARQSADEATADHR